MKKLTFKQLPTIVKIGLGIVFYNAGWSIEEFVIDRHGLGKYVPQAAWPISELSVEKEKFAP
jgi:hypothetical protein